MMMMFLCPILSRFGFLSNTPSRQFIAMTCRFDVSWSPVMNPSVLSLACDIHSSVLTAIPPCQESRPTERGVALSPEPP